LMLLNMLPPPLLSLRYFWLAGLLLFHYAEGGPRRAFT